MKNDINYFYVADRSKSVLYITGSLVATIIGASSGIGIAAKFAKIGVPAIWWLLSGSAGLLMLGFFFINKIDIKENYTLPEFLGKKFGKEIRILSALCICISWIGILSAQIFAGGILLNYFFPSLNIFFSYTVIGLIFIIYTIWEGQISVINTDLFQFIFFMICYIILFYLLFNKNIFVEKIQVLPASLANEKFTCRDILEMLIIVGFPYLIGPDIYSRLFSANSVKTAKISLILSAIIILLISIIIYFIVEFYTIQFPTSNKTDSLFYEIINNTIKNIYLKIFIILGFLSILLSSSLLSTSTIFTYDILYQIFPKNSYIKNNIVPITKISILLFGLISIAASFFSQEIINNLYISYTIYTTTICVPTFLILMFKNLKLNKTVLVVSILSSSAVLLYFKFFKKLSGAGFIGLLTSLIVVLTGILIINSDKIPLFKYIIKLKK